MENFRNVEELLAWIVDFFAVKFGNSAILKGGMSLRLMHSPRFTNDVDYIFIPFDSKKDVKTIIEDELSKINGLKFESSLNSKALRILISFGNQQAQIEISAEKDCPSIPMSSSLLSTPYGRPARIIRVMEPSIAFAHKIAAWNERGLMRDLYDVYQYDALFGLAPDTDVLQKRLKNARSYANVVAAKNMLSLIEKLQAFAKELKEVSFDELKPLLAEEDLAGLLYRMRPSILSLCEKLGNSVQSRKK
ncbi:MULTISPECIES: nucleotidyl transferase AbiEii/AbiGii toxin family protein [unclassified Fibrobacter]|uniref:nucleotidyl transferase AbiEii/AbiGii toxin family protein n=1 Tax=unclassified Fibrobacter TaxID=2634177 RepID=UPI000D6A8C1E|nr:MULTISPECIES: nucleotidyl transferase AbiEii/AbiGii toxin family protein [unclassified Fibrobacter]PWJ62784.1 nucleotidyltransferase AbiEii toxin of type IV toxin-antitoxin system [Fibrobacter sp. UWR4]PZW63725.1 nucleotidyltransferase AbiEii toxin of type IV toxin-antitoxin system [Fibrobacter sp. UWR1]